MFFSGKVLYSYTIVGILVSNANIQGMEHPFQTEPTKENKQICGYHIPFDPQQYSYENYVSFEDNNTALPTGTKWSKMDSISDDESDEILTNALLDLSLDNNSRSTTKESLITQKSNKKLKRDRNKKLKELKLRYHLIPHIQNDHDQLTNYIKEIIDLSQKPSSENYSVLKKINSTISIINQIIDFLHSSNNNELPDFYSLIKNDPLILIAISKVYSEAIKKHFCNTYINSVEMTSQSTTAKIKRFFFGQVIEIIDDTIEYLIPFIQYTTISSIKERFKNLCDKEGLNADINDDIAEDTLYQICEKTFDPLFEEDISASLLFLSFNLIQDLLCTEDFQFIKNNLKKNGATIEMLLIERLLTELKSREEMVKYRQETSNQKQNIFFIKSLIQYFYQKYKNEGLNQYTLLQLVENIEHRALTKELYYNEKKISVKIMKNQRSSDIYLYTWLLRSAMAELNSTDLIEKTKGLKNRIKSAITNIEEYYNSTNKDKTIEYEFPAIIDECIRYLNNIVHFLEDLEPVYLNIN